MTFLLLFLVLFIRLLRTLKERRRERLFAVWRPLLAQTISEIQLEGPRVREKDIGHFLYLWNYYHESVRGEAQEHLTRLAYLMGIERAALRLLQKGRISDRLLAVTTLGNLQAKLAWEELHRLAFSASPLLSLVSARAMIQIDRSSAVSLLVPLIASRSDWPDAKLVSILGEAGCEAIAGPLSEAAFSASPERGARLIKLIEANHCVAALPLVRARIQEGNLGDRLIAACLSLFGQLRDPIDVEIVRSYLRHPNWLVRLAAVTALGRVGTAEDEEKLIGLLSDTEWWVRHRAAEALANLPFLSRRRLAEIYAEQTNPDAKGVLAPFLAEAEAC